MGSREIVQEAEKDAEKEAESDLSSRQELPNKPQRLFYPFLKVETPALLC